MTEGALHIGGRRPTPMIFQDESTECGLACIAMILARYGYQTDLLGLRSRFGNSLSGTTIKRLAEIAGELELDARAIRCEPHHLETAHLPLILHWQFNHFVVLHKITGVGRGRLYHINDPEAGPLRIGIHELSNKFTGVVLEIEPSISFEKKREKSRLSIWRMWSKSNNLSPTIFRLIVLSLGIELLSLASPLFLQIGLDSVLPSNDLDFLNSLAIGFGLIAVMSLLASYLKTYISTALTSQLSFSITSNLFRHLTRLPHDWFQKRSVGDVLSRFNASQPIVDFIGSSLGQIIIDAVMAAATLVLMLVYSPLLAGVTILGLTIYAIIRCSYIGILRMRNFGLIKAQAKEQAALIETVRGNMPIRLFAKQNERLARWQTLRSTTVETSLAISRLQAAFTTANGFVIAAENIAFVYLALRLNMSHQFTIGMITAFGSYKEQFLSAGLGLVGKFVDYKMLDPSLTRLSDIALSPTEQKQIRGHHSETIDSIELKGVSFSYNPGDPLVLKAVNLVIRRGDKVAIMGRSGGGKTSLLKILISLNRPTHGVMLVNGSPIAPDRLDSYRSKIGTVMQDDILFAGSIAENICFFEARIDLDRIRRVANLACLDGDVMAMPMGYDTLVGDMGSALSGGQRQRVLLARALYRNPQILITDEATAHLDPETEDQIAAALEAAGITQVVVAHRARPLAGAIRQFTVDKGWVREVQPHQSERHLLTEGTEA